MERILATMRPGNRVRVRLANESVLEGTFLGSEDAVLKLDGADTTGVSFAQIDSLWEQRISKRKGQIKWAVTTGAVMATAGTLLFLAAASGAAGFSEGEGPGPQGAEWALIGLAGFGVGGLVGAGLGTVLGTAFSDGDPVWVQQYPEVGAPYLSP